MLRTVGLRLGRRTDLRFSSSLANTEPNKETKRSSTELVKDEREKRVVTKDVDTYEMQTVLKEGLSGDYMDRIWELNIRYREDKEYNKLTDVTFVNDKARQRMTRLIDVVSHHPWRLKSADAWKNRLRKYIDYREENRQKYDYRRHAILGPELGTANFVVANGGKVKFQRKFINGDSKAKHRISNILSIIDTLVSTDAPTVWITHLRHIPNKYKPGYKLIEVDASDLKLRDEALDNFQQLYSLERLNLSSNVLDDWSCDILGRMFRNSGLQSLYISNNPMVTHRGIETLHRIRSLKELNIKGTSAAKYPFLELLIFSFNELVPKCLITYE